MSSRWGCSLQLSSFMQFPSLHTHTHTLHIFFIPLFPCRAAEKKKTEWKRSWCLWQSRGPHQLCLIAEVFDLINDTGLHCEPNRTQIKKLVMLKMLRVRGRLFHLLSESMPFNKTEYFNALSRLLFVRCTTREYLHLGSEYFGASGICRILLLNPRCCLGDASLVCQSSALTVLPPSFI